MTLEEFKKLYGRAAAAFNINIISAETDLSHLAEYCVYGGKYNRGISETFQEFALDVNHTAKESIFKRELNSAGIKTQ